MQDYIPNPFDKRGTLGTFSKASASSGQAISLFFQLRQLLGVLLLGFVFVGAFHLPWVWLWLIIIGQIIGLWVGIAGFFKIRRLKTENTSTGIVEPIIIARRAQIINLFCSFPVVIVFVLGWLKTAHLGQYSLLALIIILVGALAILIANLVELKGYRAARNTADTGGALQEVQIARARVAVAQSLLIGAGGLVFAVGGSYLATTRLTNAGSLVAFCILFGLATLMAPIVSIISLRRMKAVEVSSAMPEAATVPRPPVSPSSAQSIDEPILAKLYGIRQNSSLIQGASFMGAGEYYYPENTLIVTPRRLVFLTVPMPGGNKIIGDQSYVEDNFFFNRGQLQENGEALLATHSLDQALAQDKHNFAVPYQDISRFELLVSRWDFKFFTTDGKKHSYMTMDKDMFPAFQAALQPLLGDRLVIK